eukprot:3101698-Prymnesium_polylepis.1
MLASASWPSSASSLTSSSSSTPSANFQSGVAVSRMMQQRPSYHSSARNVFCVTVPSAVSYSAQPTCSSPSLFTWHSRSSQSLEPVSTSARTSTQPQSSGLFASRLRCGLQTLMVA